MSAKTLIIAACSGLCNRMMAVAGGAIHAKALDRNLKVYWPKNGSLNFQPDELFRDFPFEVVKDDYMMELFGAHPRVQMVNHDEVIQGFDDWGRDILLIKAVIAPVDKPKQVIPSWDAPIVGEYMNDIFLQFKDHVWRAINGPMDSRPVAVHIRRGDSMHLFKDSTNAAFIREMRALGPDQKFLVSTDCKSTRFLFQKEFGGQVAFPTGLSHIRQDRYSLEVTQAYIDELFYLKQCKAIIGNEGSTYSKSISMMGNIPLTIAK